MKLWCLATLTALCLNASAAVQTYTGLANGGVNSEVVSGGTLQLSGNVDSPISFTFTRGGSDMTTMGNCLVLFLDSVAGGYINTSGFTDRSSAATRAISGLNANGNLRSTANFANGFAADYALVINPDIGVLLYQLGGGDLTRIDPQLLGPYPSPTARSYSFSVGRDSLGMSGTDTLRFQSTYITGTGYRTLESFEALHGADGFNEVWFDQFNLFEVQPVPEMTNVALAIFGGLFVSFSCLRRMRSWFRVRRI